jgi:hypothetical protein
MASASISDTIEAPLARVWQVMSDFGGVAGELIETCEVEGNGVGAVRTLTLRGGAGTVVERLEAMSDSDHSYSYAILNDDTCPLPVRKYRAAVRLSEAGPNATRVEWSGMFEPKGGASEADVVKLIEGVYRGGVARTRKKLGLG